MTQKKNQTPLIDRATPAIRKSRKTDVDKVQCTRSTTLAMQASASWALAIDVQGTVKGWNKSADDIEANAALIAGLKDQLQTAESRQRVLRRAWLSCTAQVLSTVNVFCNGSANMVKDWSFDVRTRTAPGAQAAPEDVTVLAGKQLGETVAGWSKGSAHHGFVVQHATDPADPATYSAATPCTKTKYTLGGSPSGSTVHFRVAAHDPTLASGIGPWSAWTAGTAK